MLTDALRRTGAVLPLAIILLAAGAAVGVLSGGDAAAGLARAGAALPVTLALALGALSGGMMTGTALGLAAALHPRSLEGAAAAGLAGLGPALPGFVLAALLATTFGSGTADAALALAALALPVAASAAREARGRLAAALAGPVVLAARGRGVSARAALTRHALPPVLAALVRQTGMLGGAVLCGAAAAEVLFGLPGAGALLVQDLRRGEAAGAAATLATLAVTALLIETAGAVLADRLAPPGRLR
ncbi:ABC transporter permease subunit [Azospirillum sp. RWY-5-1]|uniref:ABC transporter permease subunit n=1 Tax=Azospirillum oleiclasticum TaxID=2735135 RepID=A0ABX2T7E9_9PROT|nr:ABC transporter permease subunit [Azospirillum oleiclasticum]NYZ13211.1 ABC transporter permease subunit [Azospirillum oleiclasticum]NYZ20116.1 ABC transporter permease subunit [Azospirillum oleiclasticum]